MITRSLRIILFGLLIFLVSPISTEALSTAENVIKTTPSLNSFAAPISPPIDIRTNERDSEDPSGAYNNIRYEYLVVWSESIVPGQETAVYGRRLSKDGDPLGLAFPIMSAKNKIYQFPVVVYTANHDKYWIIFFEKKSDKWDIWAKSIKWNGEPEYQFRLAAGIYGGPAAAAYDSLDDRVLVVYELVTAGTESVIQAVCIEANLGGDCGQGAAASTTDMFLRQPDVAYNRQRNEALILYYKLTQSSNDSDIFGKRCKSDLTWCSPEIKITAAGYPPQYNPAVASGPDEYLAVWRENYDGGSDKIWGRRVAGDGTLQSFVNFTPDSESYLDKPATAYGDGGHYLVASFDSSDVLGRFIRSGENTIETELFRITQSKNTPVSVDVTCGASAPCLVVYSEAKNLGNFDIHARLVGHWRNIFLPIVRKK